MKKFAYRLPPQISVKYGNRLPILISCSIEIQEHSKENVFQIDDKVSIRINDNHMDLRESEIQILIKGVQSVYNNLIKEIDADVFFIDVNYLAWDWVEFQEDALACAIAMCLADMLEFDYDHPNVYYDELQRKYIFEWD